MGRDPGATPTCSVIPRDAEEDVLQVVEDQGSERAGRDWRIREGKCLQRHKDEQAASILAFPNI